MGAAEIIAIVAQVIKTAVDLGPTIIQGVEDATPFASAIYRTLTGSEITQAQLDELEAEIARLSAELQAPMEGEDDSPIIPTE